MMLLAKGDHWEGGLLLIELLKWLWWLEAVHALWQEWVDSEAMPGGRAFSGRLPSMLSPMLAGRGREVGIGVGVHGDLICAPEGKEKR